MSERLEQAIAANHERDGYVPFTPSPSARLHPDGAPGMGEARFHALLGQRFDMGQPGTVSWVGNEVSPWTREPLGITYARPDADALVQAMHTAWPGWRALSPDERVSICERILDAWSADVFANAHATMHTTGQAFMLAFAGSGASSLDRGLEALAMAASQMRAVPRYAKFSRTFGRGEPVVLDKQYTLVPVGIALVFSCGSYPAWNAYPAILANLATGNPVVLKPHPDTILPMAMAVQTARDVLADAGLDPNVITLAPDTWDDPIAAAFLDRPDVRIIDFTGGQRYGEHLASTYAHKQVYTETAGTNSVVIHSVDDVDAVCRALATGLCLFSGQMCTTPQNLWLSADGVMTSEGRLAPMDFVARLSHAVDAVVANQGTAVCGALHIDRTLDDIEHASHGGQVLRPSTPVPDAEHERARTASPLLVAVDPAHRAVVQREHFGPIAFVLVAPTWDEALAGATSDAQTFGAIASYGYSTDPLVIRDIEQAYLAAGASVGINLVRQAPMNFTAAFSDFHVTGTGPAGTACLTDAAFVARRFRIVQSKVERPTS